MRLIYYYFLVSFYPVWSTQYPVLFLVKFYGFTVCGSSPAVIYLKFHCSYRVLFLFILVATELLRPQRGVFNVVWVVRRRP
jgi:hypothetical protein